MNKKLQKIYDEHKDDVRGLPYKHYEPELNICELAEFIKETKENVQIVIHVPSDDVGTPNPKRVEFIYNETDKSIKRSEE